jgi:hypothetical protein
MATAAKKKGDASLEAVLGVFPTILRGRSLDRGVQDLDFQVVQDPKEPGVVYCKVDITGDTRADRDAIKKKFKSSEGWTCTNTGDKTATCTNP